MKRGIQRGLALTGVAAAVVLLSAAPAAAATATWFSGNASHNVKYTEGTAWQSRTGITASFDERYVSGCCRVDVWFGTASTSSWEGSATISNSRSYNKGALRWVMPGGISSDQVRMKGVANNVGPLSRVAPTAQQAALEPSEAPPSAVEVAADLGMPEIVEVGSSGGFSIWEAIDGGNGGWLLVESPTGAVFVSGSEDALADGSVSIRVADLVDGEEVSHEYVLLDQSDADALAAAQESLEHVGAGVFAVPDAQEGSTELKLSDDVVVRTLGQESLAE